MIIKSNCDVFKRSATLGFILVVLSAQPAYAEPKASPAPLSSSTDAACVSYKPVIGRADGQAVVIVVPSDKSRAFLKRGFSTVVCAGAAILSPPERKYICDFLIARDGPMNAELWQRYGITPEEACFVLRDAPSN